MSVGDLILEIDENNGQVRLSGNTFSPPPLSFKLLLALARAAPDPLDTSQIRQQVWGDVHVSPDTVKQRVKLLRASFDENNIGRGRIETVAGVGYRLQGNVHVVPRSITKSEQVVPASGARHRLSWSKNIPGVVAVIILALTISIIGVLKIQKQDSGPLRIVVLPFAELNVPDEEKSFGSGLREELIGYLSRHEGIDTISGQTSSTLGEQSVSDIGKLLNVEAIIEGAVRHAGGETRLSVRLIEAESEVLIWSREYVLAPQADLAELSRLVTHISKFIFLRLETIRPMGSRPGDSRESIANKAYLQGLDLMMKPTRANSYESAIVEFEAAIISDPEFALARARLAECLARLALNAGENDNVTEYASRAMLESARAIEQAESLPEAYYARALALLANGHDSEAAVFFEMALSERPYLAREIDYFLTGR